MRSDRNDLGRAGPRRESLDDWDMRSDRNSRVQIEELKLSLDDWDMRSDRNHCPIDTMAFLQSR